MGKDISVIIVTYNSEKHIFDCLNSLFKYNDIGDALEVIIVDNQSKDFASLQKKLIDQYRDSIKIVINDRNGGYGQGNNVGIRMASAPIIMIMNPDVRMVESLFKQALLAFENPNVVQFGVKSLDKNGNIGTSIGIASNLHPYLSVPLFTICNRMGWFIPRMMYLIGACFFVRKSVFEDAGLFDERIFMYGEEADIHHRIMALDKKYTIVYDHSLSYAHLHGLYADKKDDGLSMHRNALKNSIMIEGERGISRTTIIKHSIAHARLSMLKARFSNLVHPQSSTVDYLNSLKIWKNELESML